MQSYVSLIYLGIFLPAVMLLYNLMPQKPRRIVLLLASYIFFWLVSGKLVIYLLVSTVSIHYFGLWMASILDEKKRVLSQAEKSEKKEIKARYQRQLRGVITLAVLLNVGVLVVLKYSAFLGTNINILLAALKAPFAIPIPSFLLPIGISFYTMQALSYLFDVYRETIKADRNLERLALYMSFFPQIMEGPICRYSQTAMQLWDCQKISYSNMTMGLQRILMGVMKKVVIADRLNILIKVAFTNYSKYDGSIMLIAMVCYTCQLYMDFSGAMDVVIGTGQIFGIKMPENFRQPFFSRTISEFWTRWHISLGAWFRDYVFYPLSMSKPLKQLTISSRKHLGNHFGPLVAGSIALFSVWLLNGLWHGSGWQYIFFGMFHFVLILMGSIVEPFVKKGTEQLHINRNSIPYKGMQIFRTVCLVNIGELFFRAENLSAGFAMFKNMVMNFTFASFHGDSLHKLGMDRYDIVITIIAVAIVLFVSIQNERGISVRKSLANRNIVVRWAVIYALIFFVIIYGAYGAGYVPLDPIYANF